MIGRFRGLTDFLQETSYLVLLEASGKTKS